MDIYREMKTQMLPATSKLNYGNTWIKLNKNYLQSLFTYKICEEQNERYVQNSLFPLYMLGRNDRESYQ